MDIGIVRLLKAIPFITGLKLRPNSSFLLQNQSCLDSSFYICLQKENFSLQLADSRWNLLAQHVIPQIRTCGFSSTSSSLWFTWFALKTHPIHLQLRHFFLTNITSVQLAYDCVHEIYINARAKVIKQRWKTFNCGKCVTTVNGFR